MAAKISKSGYESTGSDSTDSSGIPCLPNYHKNGIAVSCSAADEFSETNLWELTSILKIKDNQNPKTTADSRNILHQMKELNLPILYSKENEHRTSYYCPCACNPYDIVQELILSVREGQQNTKSPDVSTCRLKSKCTAWVENLFTKKYGSKFTKNLVFAVDMLMLMRNVNGLGFRYILYPTNNSAPESPCDQRIDDAFILILKTSAERIEKLFDDAMKGKDVNYKNFQILLLQLTLDWEMTPYSARKFLMYCVTIGQWAVYAEKKGVERACYFAPLVICRTIHRLSLWTKVPPTFWKDLVEAADELIKTWC